MQSVFRECEKCATGFSPVTVLSFYLDLPNFLGFFFSNYQLNVKRYAALFFNLYSLSPGVTIKILVLTRIFKVLFV